MEACMKKLLLAGAAALLLTGAMADPSFAAKGGGHGGPGVSGRAGTGGGATAPRAAVTAPGATGINRAAPGGYTRGPGAVTGRTGTWAGRGGPWAGRAGHWAWRHHHRVFVPFAAGVGPGLAFGYDDDDCVVWNGWRWVNVCGPYDW
jgi:hypothetical protein